MYACAYLLSGRRVANTKDGELDDIQIVQWNVKEKNSRVFEGNNGGNFWILKPTIRQ